MNARDELKRDLMRALNLASIDSMANAADHVLAEKIIDAPSLRGYRDRNQNAELVKYKRGAKTLGEIIEKQCRDVLDVTGLHHLINEGGDGAWDVVWFRLFEMRDELASLKESTIGRERLRGDKWRDRAQEMEVSRDAAIERAEAADAILAAGYRKQLTIENDKLVIEDGMLLLEVGSCTCSPHGSSHERGCGYEYLDDLTKPLARAGYRKPRVVTTVEELDAAISAAFEDARPLILSDRAARPWIIWEDEDGDAWVESWPQEDDPERLRLSDIALPATVLHEPEADQ